MNRALAQQHALVIVSPTTLGQTLPVAFPEKKCSSRVAEVGLAGPSRGPRVALILSGAGALLLIPYFPLVFAAPVVALVHYAAVAPMTVIMTVVVVVTVVRRRDLTGAARWAFAGLAVVAVLSLVLPIALALQALSLIVSWECCSCCRAARPARGGCPYVVRQAAIAV